MEHIVLSSTITFMPKIVQFKFRLLPGNAALLFGFVSIPASLIGNLSGENNYSRNSRLFQEFSGAFLSGVLTQVC